MLAVESDWENGTGGVIRMLRSRRGVLARSTVGKSHDWRHVLLISV